MFSTQKNGRAIECAPSENKFSKGNSTLGLSNEIEVTSIGEAAKARQRALVFDALRAGPLSTLDARERLGVLHSPARVLELRKAGHRIETRMETRFDAASRPHRCGVYHLVQEGGAS